MPQLELTVNHNTVTSWVVKYERKRIFSVHFNELKKKKKTIPTWLSMWLIHTRTQTWAYTAWEQLTSAHHWSHSHPLFSAIRVVNWGHRLRILCKMNMLLSFSYLQICKLLWLEDYVEHLGNFPKKYVFVLHLKRAEIQRAERIPECEWLPMPTNVTHTTTHA